MAERKICIELKTINGFGFRQAVGDGRYEAKGPRHSAIVQGALNAKASGADELVIIYLSLEAISKQAANRAGIDDLRRIMAEWHYTPEQFLPIADREIARWQKIIAGVDEGKLPLRRIPDPEIHPRNVIVDPALGRWEAKDQTGNLLDAGTHWSCAYCSHQTKCALDNSMGV